MNDYVTAAEARRLRLLVGKPLAEVDRLYQLESFGGYDPRALVMFDKVGEPVNYADLRQRETACGRPWPTSMWPPAWIGWARGA